MKDRLAQANRVGIPTGKLLRILPQQYKIKQRIIRIQMESNQMFFPLHLAF
jgi:hypothetical protein